MSGAGARHCRWPAAPHAGSPDRTRRERAKKVLRRALRRASRGERTEATLPGLVSSRIRSPRRLAARKRSKWSIARPCALPVQISPHGSEAVASGRTGGRASPVPRFAPTCTPYLHARLRETLPRQAWEQGRAEARAEGRAVWIAPRGAVCSTANVRHPPITRRLRTQSLSSSTKVRARIRARRHRRVIRTPRLSRPSSAAKRRTRKGGPGSLQAPRHHHPVRSQGPGRISPR